MINELRDHAFENFKLQEIEEQIVQLDGVTCVVHEQRVNAISPGRPRWMTEGW